MDHPDPHESAWVRARAETQRILQSTTFGLSVALIEAVVVPLAAIIATADQVAASVLAGALVLVLAVGGLFLIRLVAAPVQQRNDLRRAWPSGPTSRSVNVELSLRNFARIGDERATYLAQSEGLFKEDHAWADAWAEEVVQFLSDHVPPDQARMFIETDGVGLVRKLRARATKLREIADATGGRH